MAEEQYERREQAAEKERLLKLQAAMKSKPMMLRLRERNGGAGPKSNVHPPSSDCGATSGPKSAESHRRDPSSQAESKPVRPGQTESNEIEAPSVHPPPQSSDATRRNSKDQAPMLTAASPSESKPVKPNQPDSESAKARPVEGDSGGNAI